MLRDGEVKRTTLCFVFDRPKGLLLMIEKKRGQGAGKWNVPGGKLQKGESEEAAAIRETIEETGIEPADLRLAGRLEFYFPESKSWDNTCAVYTAEKFSGSLVAENEECSAHWVAVDKIPYDKMWDDDRLWVPLLLAGAPFHRVYTFDAFPDKCDGLACALLHPTGAALETGLGLAALATAGDAYGEARSNKANNGIFVDPDKMLENNARRVAIEELKVANPKGAALLTEKLDVEILKTRYAAAASDPAALRALKSSPAMAGFEDRLHDLEAKRSELKTLERQLGTRSGELVAAVKKGSAIPAGLADAASSYKRLKPGLGLQVAIGALLVADGGLRIAAIANGKNYNPGYLPSVSMGTVVVKRLVGPMPAPESDAATSMDIK
ncbi:MAG: 8-oxo-dGTP diphosphatase [Proteobacteria bacterium]|nr:MAG: 8-oxo-dGTP diphosphatase [Pseudomonadota bacterium]